MYVFMWMYVRCEMGGCTGVACPVHVCSIRRFVTFPILTKYRSSPPCAPCRSMYRISTVGFARLLPAGLGRVRGTSATTPSLSTHFVALFGRVCAKVPRMLSSSRLRCSSSSSAAVVTSVCVVRTLLPAVAAFPRTSSCCGAACSSSSLLCIAVLFPDTPRTPGVLLACTSCTVMLCRVAVLLCSPSSVPGRPAA